MPLVKPSEYELGSVDNNRANLIHTTSELKAQRTLEISKIITGKGASRAVRALVGCYQVVPGTNVRAGISVSMQIPVGVETLNIDELLAEMSYDLFGSIATVAHPVSDNTKDGIFANLRGVAAGVITPA